MTDSALIVFLPLVGAILGAVVGAVGGAWANSWYRDRGKVQKYGKAAMMHGGKYMFVDYPEFTDAAHAKFVEEARKLVDE